MADFHSTHSVLRERIVEHLFVGEILRYLWTHKALDMEVLHSEFDAHGYDIVMSCQGIIRHIQLKTKLQHANKPAKKPTRVQISRNLMNKQNGCLIWIIISENLDLGPFYWFGDVPNQPLPDITQFSNAKKIRRTAAGIRNPRTNHHVIPTSRFEKVENIEDIIVKLFGHIGTIT